MSLLSSTTAAIRGSTEGKEERMSLDEHLTDVPLITPEQIAALEAVHGEIFLARGTRADRESPTGRRVTWQIAMRRPTKSEYLATKSRSANPAQAPQANEMLVKMLLVHPSKEEFEKLLDKWRGICEAPSTNKAIAALLGWEEDDTEK
ncbi:MAG: hypothetical protein NVS3B10_00140 [Polyangiales bacterium]